MRMRQARLPTDWMGGAAASGALALNLWSAYLGHFVRGGDAGRAANGAVGKRSWLRRLAGWLASWLLQCAAPWGCSALLRWWRGEVGRGVKLLLLLLLRRRVRPLQALPRACRSSLRVTRRRQLSCSKAGTPRCPCSR